MITPNQVFPFFSWSLFSRVPQGEEEYHMIMQDGVDIVTLSTNPIITRYAVQQYAEAYVSNDDRAIRSFLPTIRSLITIPPGTVVTLTRVTGDPVDIYLHGIQKSKSLTDVTL